MLTVTPDTGKSGDKLRCFFFVCESYRILVVNRVLATSAAEVPLSCR